MGKTNGKIITVILGIILIGLFTGCTEKDGYDDCQRTYTYRGKVLDVQYNDVYDNTFILFNTYEKAVPFYQGETGALYTFAKNHFNETVWVKVDMDGWKEPDCEPSGYILDYGLG